MFYFFTTYSIIKPFKIFDYDTKQNFTTLNMLQDF